MKLVVMLAGAGRRLNSVTASQHKSMIPIQGQPVLQYFLSAIQKSEVSEIIPILGYRAEEVLALISSSCKSFKGDIRPVYNLDYLTTNNLVSVCKAAPIVDGKPFILANGDLMIQHEIISRAINSSFENAIVIDNSSPMGSIDSPKVRLDGNGRIVDLSRSVPDQFAVGYAIGMYKFGEKLSGAFFKQANQMIFGGNLQAGFHDPLPGLFSSFSTYPVYTDGLLWSDIDTPEDIPRLEILAQQISQLTKQGSQNE